MFTHTHTLTHTHRQTDRHTHTHTHTQYLTEIHDDTLMHFLPQVSSKDLNEGDFECWDFSMHEDASEIELHLEAHIDVGSIDRWRPPQREPTVGNLVKPTALSVSQLLIFHGLFKAGSLLPEKTLPSWKVRALEEGVFQNAFYSSQRLDHVCAIVVEVPELSIVALVCPPKRVLLQHLHRYIRK